MISSIIDKNLIASYLSANYQIGMGSNSIFLRVDQYSEPLAKFLAASRQPCAAIISAYNPFSQPFSNEENLAAHELLRDFLSRYSYPIIESLNTDPSERWPAEKSFCVLGQDLDASQSVGRHFNQNAIVWMDSHATPRLILLR